MPRYIVERAADHWVIQGNLPWEAAVTLCVCWALGGCACKIRSAF